MTAYTIRAHDGQLDAKAFSCGQSALDDYIRRYASQDVKRDLARVFVASPKAVRRFRATTAWTDICSCNICIPHILVGYAGGRATQEQLPSKPPHSRNADNNLSKLWRLPSGESVTVLNGKIFEIA